MLFVEHFNHTMLVEHLVEPKGRKTLCGEPLKGKLPARPVDIRRAAKGRSTCYTRCFDCAVAL